MKRMRVGIDGHMVGGQETGNETYIKGLVDGLAELKPELDALVFHVDGAWASARPPLTFQRLVTGSPYFRLVVDLPARSVTQRLDVLHMTYAAPVWSAAPIVLTVHDICYATNPEWFSERDLRVLNAVIPRSIRQAAHVITDSNSARQEIIGRYGVPEAKISAIPIGPGAGASPISTEEARAALLALGLSPAKPYLLAVGNLQPRKNLERLIQAFQVLVRDRGHDIDLVIVGPKRFHADLIVDAARSLADRVHFTGYITDAQLAACYRCSTAFVFPSLYEGFGLPALESMAQGAPVACSTAGALPEVCGRAAVYFDPRSVDAMVDAVEKILGDANLRKSLVEAGLSRAREFSWRRTAELTVEIYRRAASSS